MNNLLGVLPGFHVGTLPWAGPWISKRALITLVALATLASFAEATRAQAQAMASGAGGNAGAGSYLACIGLCRGNDTSWITAIVCPIICTPFLLVGG